MFVPGDALTKPLQISVHGITVKGYRNQQRGEVEAHDSTTMNVPEKVASMAKFANLHKNTISYWSQLVQQPQDTIPDPYIEFPQLNELEWKKRRQQLLHNYANQAIARYKKGEVSARNTPESSPGKKKKPKKCTMIPVPEDDDEITDQLPSDDDDEPPVEQLKKTPKPQVRPPQTKADVREKHLDARAASIYTDMASTYLNTTFKINLCETNTAWFTALGRFYGITIPPMYTHPARTEVTDTLIAHTAKYMQTNGCGPLFSKIQEMVVEIHTAATPFTPADKSPPVEVKVKSTTGKPQRETPAAAKKAAKAAKDAAIKEANETTAQDFAILISDDNEDQDIHDEQEKRIKKPK
jgi:hypothetical protein